MTPKKIKPVRAWALVSGEHGGLWAYWTFDRREPSPNGCEYRPDHGHKWLRVEIRPVAPKRKRKAKT